MGIDGFARRPGLVLAACAWVGFAAPASAALWRAATMTTNGSLSRRTFAASFGFAERPSLCLLVAALLVLVEASSSPIDVPRARMLAATVLASGLLAVVMTLAGVVVLPLWSTSTPASEWLAALSPSVTAAALAGVAAVLSDRALGGPQLSEFAA